METHPSRIAVPTLTGLFIAAAMGLYSDIETKNARYNGAELADLTRTVSSIAPWAFVIPIFLAAASLLFWRRKRSHLQNLTIDLMWAFSIVWPVLTLLAWKVTYILIGVRIDS